MAIKPLKRLSKPVRKIDTDVGKKLKRPLKAPSPDSTVVKRATSGGAFGQASAEKKRIDMERNVPFGLSIPVGGEQTVYLLDRKEPFYRYVHNIGGGKGKRGRDVPCIKDTNEMCPVCSKEGKEGTFVMYLTCVVPIDKYTPKSGENEGKTVTRHYQKKLFPIKIKMADKYRRIYEKYGSFRGLVLKINRDGEFDPGTGNDVEVLKKLPEAKIKEYAKGLGTKNADARKAIIDAKIDEPFDYKQIFPSVTAAELAKMVHASASEGVGTEDIGGSDDDFGGDAEWA
jgi:hypothetical protein